MPRTLRFDPPQGIIQYKYVAFRDGDDFAEEGVTGPFATAKSTMGIDFLMRRGFEYPGIVQLMTRATLADLKDSTLMSLERRWGAFFMDNGGSMNRERGIYRFPPTEDPVTGEKVQSTIRGIGLDRGDLEHVLRSREIGSTFVEEADEVSTDAIDMIQFRSRGVYFHRSQKVADLCIDLAQRWRLHPDEVYEILLADRRHPVGKGQLAWDHPRPSTTVVKCAWNAFTNAPIWQRFVGLAYPTPEPTPDWVKDHVGVREVRVEPERWKRRSGFRFMAGSIVLLPPNKHRGSQRRFAAWHRDGVIGLVPDPDNENAPSEVPEDDCTLVVQRNCIYVFPSENESRDFRNDENSFLAQNQDMASKFFQGTMPERSGRVFGGYIDDYAENGGHLLRYPGRDALARRGWPLIGGLDKGGRHAHGTAMAMVAPGTHSAILYAEYARHGIGARDHAIDSQALILPGAPNTTWGYDPSMDAKRYDQDADYRTIEEYQDVLGAENLFHGVRGDEGFDLLQRMLMRHETLIHANPMPRLLVFDNLIHVRKMFMQLTWEMIDRQRDNYLVDIADAVKYMVSVMRITQLETASDADIFQPSLAYTNNRRRHRSL